MKLNKKAAAAVGVVCGAELVVAIVISGAGLSTIFGWNAALVAAIVVALIVVTMYQRRRPAAT